MFGEYNPGALAPFLGDQVNRLAIGWPPSIPQADAQPYVVFADGTRRLYGAVEPAEPVVTVEPTFVHVEPLLVDFQSSQVLAPSAP